MMKRIYLFVLACAIAMSPAITEAQSTASSDQEKKRVVIVKKSIDENGDVLIEKTIGEGDKAEVVLKEMALQEGDENVNITIIRNLESDEEGAEKERLFMFRSAGGEKVEGRLEKDENVFFEFDSDVEIEHNEEGNRRVIVIRSNDEEGELSKVEEVIVHLEGDESMPAEVREKVERVKARVMELHEAEGEYAYAFNWKGNEFNEDKTNCAALGVYVNTSRNSDGVRINDLIGGGGAEDSGLQQGDHIVAIEDDYVNSYTDLLKALKKYVPGDDVNVSFNRDGVEANVVVTLKAWGEMPTMANTWRARVTCDEKEYEIEKYLDEVEKETKEKDVPTEVEARSFDNTLSLNDFTMFPNPSEGKFRVQFMTTADPVTVTITDIAGKAVYRENINRFDGIFNEQINIKKHGSGTYILTVEQNDKLYSEQVVIQ